MQIRRGKPPGSGRLARAGVELSREARVRLSWMDFYRRCRNVARTCRHFGISRQQLSVSTFMVGRILTRLKRQGRLLEAPRRVVPGSRRGLRPRPYAVCKPKQYAASAPGVVCKQFTARDLISRWDVLQAHTRATAQTATQFLDTLQHRMPFPIRAV